MAVEGDVEAAVDAAAEELYGLVPSEFTAARDQRARDARAGGDRGAASAIKALRRPTVSAWLANALARQRRDVLDRLLDLGDELREAQAHLAGDDLRRLSQERHQAVAALVQQARRLAEAAGHTVTEATARELEGTLEAALADPDAAAAVRAGRLTSPLQYSGLGTVDVDASVATPVAARPTKPQSKSKATPDAKAEAVAEAQESLRAARADAEHTAAALDAAASALEQAADAEQEASARVARLREHLDEAREEAAAAASARRAAEREHTAAERAARAAEARVARAEEAAARAAD